jgi:putative restriction endonuclease
MAVEQAAALRVAIGEWLRPRLARGEQTVSWTELLYDFELQGERVPLIAYRGIHRLTRFGPVPISVATTPPKPGRERPYDDRLSDDGTIEYRYFGTDPSHADNVGLRLAMEHRVPLLYLYGIEPGSYVPVFPVFVVADDPARLTVRMHVDVGADFESAGATAESRTELRAYVTRAAKRRLHQLRFRSQVVRAYRRRCAMCNLKHVLDAAHILPDHHPRGDPVVPNGLALCRLHHAAFDGNLLGVDPSSRIVVRPDVLDEEDGPVLEHGLKRLDGRRIATPLRLEWRPDPERLAERFTMFQAAG